MSIRIIVDVVNTKNEYKWRLGQEVNGKIKKRTEWTSHYEGILTIELDNGELWGYATDYWNGVLPTEIPFSIQKCRSGLYAIIEHVRNPS
jgi:hypothetical protein